MPMARLDPPKPPRPAPRAGLTLVLLALLAAAAPAAARKGTVSGTVTDTADEPLAGVEVTLATGNEPAGVATTDKKGEFSLTVAAGEYRILLVKEGYASFEIPLNVAAGDRKKVGVQLLDAAEGRRSAAAEPFNAALSAYRSGDRKAAKEGLRAAIAADPTLVRAHRLLAEVYLDEGAWAEAAEAAEAVLGAEPGDRQARIIAYEAYRKLQNGERVIALRRALGADPELAPDLAKQAFNEGLLADQAGDAATAAARFSEARELDGGLAAAHFALAALDYRAGRYEAALATLAAGLEVEPRSAQGRRLAFAIHDARGDTAAAETAMAAYGEVDAAGAAVLLFERAEADFDGGDVTAARAGFARVLELQPDHAAAHRLLGLAWLTADAAAAKRHLERFLELSPDDPEAESAREILASLE